MRGFKNNMALVKKDIHKIIIELGKLKSIPQPDGPYIKYEDVINTLIQIQGENYDD